MVIVDHLVVLVMVTMEVAEYSESINEQDDSRPDNFYGVICNDLVDDGVVGFFLFRLFGIRRI